MSILIRGMDMPKNCTGCPICCGLPYQHRDVKGRRPDCPLIELPPHGRLGDLDELYKVANMADDFGADTTDILKLIIDTPAVIEAEGET